MKQRVDLEYLGREVLTVAVLSILITAPLGAIGIMVGGRNLLNKAEKRADVEKNAENIEESPSNQEQEE